MKLLLRGRLGFEERPESLASDLAIVITEPGSFDVRVGYAGTSIAHALAQSAQLPAGSNHMLPR